MSYYMLHAQLFLQPQLAFKENDLCYTVLDIQLFLWPHRILYIEPLCDSLTYMVDVK